MYVKKRFLVKLLVNSGEYYIAKIHADTGSHPTYPLVLYFTDSPSVDTSEVDIGQWIL